MNKLLKSALLAVVAFVFLVGAFSGGFVMGHFTSLGVIDRALQPVFGSPDTAATPESSTPSSELPPDHPALPGAGSQATPEEMKTLFAPFWESWDLVHQRYVDQPVDDLALMRGAIRGMLEALGDQHTSYMDPQEFQDANAHLDGSYEGIGAYVDTSGDYLTVTSPISGSPAEAAGLRPNDQIIKIDGEDMTGISPELARRRVLGPAGTTVILTIKRGDLDLFDVSITRAKITTPSVEGKMLENGVAYIKLNTFGQTTSQEMHDTLSDLLSKNPRGLILDLRFNGGGYLDTAVEVGSEFVPEGNVLIIEQYGDGSRDVYKSRSGGIATDIPMVVLVNEGSASASEILAGALQDYGRAKLVGVTTYGKGSVQIWSPLSNDQGAVRVTIAKWLTPKERTIHKVGLTPDVVVEMTDDDYANDLDPQLDKAIEVLNQVIGGSATK